MQLAQAITSLITTGAPAPSEDLSFISTAARLARFRFSTIERLTREQPLLRRQAFLIRRRNRGPSKLARRLRRNFELGRAGSF